MLFHRLDILWFSFSLSHICKFLILPASFLYADMHFIVKNPAMSGYLIVLILTEKIFLISNLIQWYRIEYKDLIRGEVCMRSIEFAIKMELDGEQYYTEQAEKHKNTNLHTVFLTLAKDERKHANILKDRLSHLTPELSDTTSYSEYKNIFKQAEDFNSSIKETLDQVDIYSFAMDKEKEAIELYKELLANATDEQDREIFEFLIREEETHYAILEDIVSHVSRPSEWVESAEFGLREDY
jgi:rubrerythrin